MKDLRRRIRDGLFGVSPDDMKRRIAALLAELAPAERTAAVVSRGLLETEADAEQYFWTELAFEFSTSPTVMAAAKTLLRRHDDRLANHILVELLVESGDRAASDELIE